MSLTSCSKSSSSRLKRIVDLTQSYEGTIYKQSFSSSKINAVFIGHSDIEKRNYISILNDNRKRDFLEKVHSISTLRKHKFDIGDLNRQVSQSIMHASSELIIIKLNPNDKKLNQGSLTENLRYLIDNINTFSIKSKTKVIIEGLPCSNKKFNTLLKSYVKIHSELVYFDGALGLGSLIDNNCKLSEKESLTISNSLSKTLSSIVPQISPRPDRREQWRDNPENRP